MRPTDTSCVRDVMVCSNSSGCSETRMKRVLSHGSSRILSILFAASWFMASGSQMIIALYGDEKLLNCNLRIISSDSLAVMSPFIVLPRSSIEYHSSAEKMPSLWCHISRHLSRNMSLTTASPLFFSRLFTGNTQ